MSLWLVEPGDGLAGRACRAGNARAALPRARARCVSAPPSAAGSHVGWLHKLFAFRPAVAARGATGCMAPQAQPEGCAQGLIATLHNRTRCVLTSMEDKQVSMLFLKSMMWWCKAMLVRKWQRLPTLAAQARAQQSKHALPRCDAHASLSHFRPSHWSAFVIFCTHTSTLYLITLCLLLPCWKPGNGGPGRRRLPSTA